MRITILYILQKERRPFGLRSFIELDLVEIGNHVVQILQNSNDIARI